MDRPVIGIIAREYYSLSKHKINIAYKDITIAIIKSGGIPIIIPYDEGIDNYLNICSGFVFQGGDDINNYNLEIINILKEKNIPTLGICLGMQEMFFQDNLINVSDHNISGLHEIKIIKDTLLYNIIKEDTMLVNSRHRFAIDNTNYQVSSISFDNVIESIEIKEHKFFLGLQWHPENVYEDENSKKIFDYFVNICRD